MVKRTKLQQEFVGYISEAIEFRHTLAKDIAELLKDKQFPNNPDWVARALLLKYDIKKKEVQDG